MGSNFETVTHLQFFLFLQVVIHEMNRLGMLVEISRLSEPAMMVALNVARSPILLANASPQSHACNGSMASAVPDHILR
jgi:hypothetical protein